MKTYQKVVKNGTHISSVECFTLSTDKKKTKQRVAFVDSKMTTFVDCGLCKCGGRILEVVRSPVYWRVCAKCARDF